ncbi:MAG: hypothetical protein C0518_15860 [Opitutus sp.]|nr:hypothetical protein [Opitutus sp.]
MNPPVLLTPRPARSLDAFGSASRCLLRLWENQGHIALSDGEFLRRYGMRYPRWETHPGELEGDELGVLAQEFGFAAGMSETDDFREAFQAHRYGYAVIVATRCSPVQQLPVPAESDRARYMVLEQMDEDGFVVWCPFESGASALLPRADRVWWSNWSVTASILRPAYPPFV